jgi:hypothetical protein
MGGEREAREGAQNSAATAATPTSPATPIPLRSERAPLVLAGAEPLPVLVAPPTELEDVPWKREGGSMIASQRKGRGMGGGGRGRERDEIQGGRSGVYNEEPPPPPNDGRRSERMRCIHRLRALHISIGGSPAHGNRIRIRSHICISSESARS